MKIVRNLVCCSDLSITLADPNISFSNSCFTQIIYFLNMKCKNENPCVLCNLFLSSNLFFFIPDRDSYVDNQFSTVTYCTVGGWIFKNRTLKSMSVKCCVTVGITNSKPLHIHCSDFYLGVLAEADYHTVEWNWRIFRTLFRRFFVWVTILKF